MSHAELLDSIYSWQTGFYDLTRRYYLQGRDRLISDIASENYSGRIIEVGCGTGRNLIKLARKNPRLELFGLDASQAMLQVAKEKISAYPTIKVAQGYAEELNPRSMFGEEKGFDEVFFSFSVSMIPEWEKALETAITLLPPGGTLRVVDFWDQHTYPSLVRKVLQHWLKLFHVAYTPAHIDFFTKAEELRRGKVTLHPILGSYSYYLTFKKN